MEEKKCCSCEKIKQISEFGKYSYSKDGLRYQCKSCEKEYRNKNSKENVRRAKNWTIANKKPCPLCGRPMLPRSSRCYNCKHSDSSLYTKTRRMSIKELREYFISKGKDSYFVSIMIRDCCRRWNRNLIGLPCQSCGYTKHTELAHKKSIASFDENALLSVVNDPENIAVLCPNCHWEFDHGLLELAT